MKRHSRKAARGKRQQARAAKPRLRTARRESLWDLIRQRNGNRVPCFVCGEHVRRDEATLEHVVPLSKGGADAMSNYAISHQRCNSLKGDKIMVHRVPGSGIVRAVSRGDAKE